MALEKKTQQHTVYNVVLHEENFMLRVTLFTGMLIVDEITQLLCLELEHTMKKS